MIYLGIDGGGTKTEFLLTDATGKVLARVQESTVHIKQIGTTTFRKRIRQGVKTVCNQAGISPGEISYTFAGIPGYGEFKRLIPEIQQILKEEIPSPLTIGNDVEAGWAAGLGGEPGINLVLGTGAIAYGRDIKGNEARSSGWGPFCGDEGSAYWLGKKALEIFAKEADGRLPQGPLYGKVREVFKLKEDFELITLVTEAWDQGRTEIAALSRLLYEACQAGDFYAQQAFKAAGKEGAMAVKAVSKRLNFSEKKPIPVSYSGGVFNAGDYVLKSFQECLGVKYKLRKPLMQPAEGAALLAYLYSKKPIDESIKRQWTE